MIIVSNGEYSYCASHVIHYGVRYEIPITMQEIEFQFYKNCLIKAFKELK